jgi:hypothetical protein
LCQLTALPQSLNDLLMPLSGFFPDRRELI